MARPSQHLDQRLLDAGLQLLPIHGCKGLSARIVTQHAGVNLGMFHYHFGSKETFIRAVLSRLYETMFSELMLQSSADALAVNNLRNVLRVLGGFAQRNRALMSRILADAMAGETVAIEFIQTHIPRHLRILVALLGEAQERGEIQVLPIATAISFIAGAVVGPILISSPLTQQLPAESPVMYLIDQQILSDSALEQRISLALRALAVAPSP